MAISVGNDVVLIKFPGKNIGHNAPYLFSIFGATGKVTDVNGDLAAVRWSLKSSMVCEAGDLLIYNSPDYKDLNQLFETTRKFRPRQTVVLKANPKSKPGIVIAADWNTYSVLVEWPNQERQLYLEKSLVHFAETLGAFNPNLAFKMHKNSKRGAEMRSLLKKTETFYQVEDDDIPF